MLKKFLIQLLIFFGTITLFFNYCYADGFATAIGTEDFQFYPGEDYVTTTPLTEDAGDAYEECGYTLVNRLSDPRHIVLVSNLMAQVQVFSTHGTETSIVYNGVETSGIQCGYSQTMSNGMEVVGVRDVGRNCWRNNTKLITYFCCETAGRNGEVNEMALTTRTVVDGEANMALGFCDRISYATAERWSATYHNFLANGSGVKTAARFASAFLYGDSRIHSWHLVYNSSRTTEEQVIALNATRDVNSIATSYAENMLKQKNILNEEITIIDTSKNNILNQLAKIDKTIDTNNYDIETHIAKITDTHTNKEEKIEYITARLMLGDFYTNAGYVLEKKDNKIVAIYDNNINTEKQERALANIEKFSVSLSQEDINSYKKSILNTINTANSSKEMKLHETNSIDEEVKYFYDIETGKKYIEFSLISTVENYNGDENIATDIIRYEIK